MKANLTLQLVGRLATALGRDLVKAYDACRTLGENPRQSIHVELAGRDMRDFIQGLPKQERPNAIEWLRDAVRMQRNLNTLGL